MGIGIEWVAEGRERKEHLEIWKNVAHLKPDKLLRMLPGLTVYNSYVAFMAEDMCIFDMGTAHSHFREDQGHRTLCLVTIPH